MSETAPAETAGETYLKSANLGHLDSKLRFYNSFGRGSKYCSYGQHMGKAKGKLNACAEINDEVEKIADILCYVTTVNGEDSLRDDRCGFLYYWLGSKIWAKVNNNSSKFLDVMGKIYAALEQFGVKDNCTLLYKDTPNIDQQLFEKWKIIFDFSYDFNGIKAKLERSKNSCDEGYYKHLEGAKEAFVAINRGCKSKGDDDPYCKEFIFKYGKDSDINPLTLTNSGTYESTYTPPQGTEQKVNVYKGVELKLTYAPEYAAALSSKKQQASREQTQDSEDDLGSETHHQQHGAPKSAPATVVQVSTTTTNINNNTRKFNPAPLLLSYLE
ncbi:CYIR protein [Plasmodium coatneyi]|uniref:CYIR protein n=1 Tax=Plasmodium coatneyi TaxID=208452 RepID=A0A1B1E0S9_9APIC|nr:CYIR protein [Plasmodium coatneyi]ANQ08495.1 CYIR protein [Plasmodium coatneyi]